MEKMTKPANMLVQELMQHTMMESLERPRQSRNFKRRQGRGKKLKGRAQPTCTRRCDSCCSCPVQWASPGPGHRRRRSEWPHPATPVGGGKQTTHAAQALFAWVCRKNKNRKWIIQGAALADLGADELIEVGRDVEADPVDGSGKGDPTEEEDEEHEVRIGSGEVHHLQEDGGRRGRRSGGASTVQLIF